MGTNHTVQTTLTDWKVPSSTVVGPTAFIAELHTGDGGDSLQNAARFANNLYEFNKAPLHFDRWYTPILGTTGTSFETVARYRIPVHKCGTSDSSEKILLRAGMSSLGGTGTTSLQLTTNSTTGTSTTTTSSTEEEVTIAAGVAIDDNEFEQEVTIEIKNTTANTNARLHWLELYWYGGDSTLPSVPGTADNYDANTFCPLETLQRDHKAPVSVERMRRLIRNAVYFYKQRTPNVITTSWFTAALTDAAAGGTAFNGIAWQPPGVTSVKVWLYGVGDTAPNDATVTLAGASGSYSGTVSNIGTGSATWNSTTIAVNPHNRGNPEPHTVTVDLNAISLQGVCAWYETIP